MSRKRIIVSLAFAVLVSGLLLFSFRQKPIAIQQFSAKGGSASGGNTLLSSVSLYIDFSDGNVRNFSEIPYVTDATAFSIMKDIKIPMVYDPSTGVGVFIRQIGDKKNGDGGRYWQYWVNEKFVLVAADKYKLQPGDRVEWKFATEQKE